MVPPGTPPTLEELRELLTRYRRRLLDLSQRNRTLKLPRLSAQRDVDLTDLGYLDGGPPETLLGSVVQRQSVVLMRRMHTDEPQRTAADRRLTAIYRELNLMQAETGRYDLGIGYPWLEGRMADGSVVRCPLLIFPVKLERGSSLKKGAPRWSLRVRAADAPLWNEPFFRAYERMQALPLAAEFWQTEWPVCPTIQALLNALFKTLRHHGLLLSMPSALFLGRIEPFKAYIKNYLEQQAPDDLRLQGHAVLGIFPQAESAVAQDYQALNLASVAPRLGQLLSPTRPQEPLVEAPLHLPLPVDPSQAKALQHLAQGHDLVVDGPPGTGKSQVIVNAVSHCLAQGQRVLVVSAKRAALDVVHRRLQGLGLGPWCSLIHDDRLDRGSWVQAHSQHLQTLLIPPDPHDLRRAEAGLQAARAAHAEVVNRLEAHRLAMITPTAAGPSAAELYEKLLPQPTYDAVTPETVQRLEHWDEARLSAFLRQARRLSHYERLLQPSHAWYYRKSTAGWGQAQVHVQQQRLALLAEEWAEVAALQHWTTPTGSRRPLTSVALRAEADWAQRLLHQAQQNPTWPTLAQWHHQPEPSAWWREVTELRELLAHAVVAEAEATELAQTLQAYDFRLSIHLKKLSLRRRLRRWLKQRNLAASPVLIEQLRQQAAGWQRWRALIAQSPKDCQAPPPHPSDPAWQAWLPDKEFHDWLKELAAHPWRQDLAPTLTHEALQQLAHTLTRWQNQIRRWAELYEGWRAWLHPHQVDVLDAALPQPQQAQATIELWRTSWQADCQAMIELDTLVAAWPEPEQELWQWLGPLTVTHAHWEALVQQAAWRAWLQVAEAQRPELAYAHTPMHQADRHELPALEEHLRLALRQWLPQTLHHRAHEALSQASGATLAELGHQLAKTRRAWPLRRLFHQFWGEALGHSCRCVLASPETISNIMPMQPGMVDVVILDEASQVTVEAVLPTLLRGRQALVAGDEQQLPPFDLFQVNPLEEAEYAAEEDAAEPNPATGLAPHELWHEAESILQLCRRSWPHVPLQWHYRSRQPELMGFSNHHFYGGQLRVVPVAGAPDAAYLPPLRYQQVKGVWHQRRNVPEAKAVVAELRQWVLRPDPPSLGVITLNYGQREAITDALEAHLETLHTPAAQPELAAWTQALTGAQAGEGLFIKNLENVQGDERDVIILGLGYAPNPAGRLRAQYGWLNLPGGEKRLNVAVSRARQCLVVITHLHPSELPLSPDALPGPRLLAAYLSHVLHTSSGRAEHDTQGVNAGSAPEMPQQWLSPQGVCTVSETHAWLSAGSAQALYGQVVPLLQGRGWQVQWHSVAAAWRARLR